MPGYSGKKSRLFWIATGKPNSLTPHAFCENFSYGFRRQMTWVPIRHAVRKLREAAKLEQRELAKKSGLTERAIRLLESKSAPKTMYAATVKALAGTLKCAPEDLATWIPRRRGHDVDDEIQSVIALPPASTLARRAQREQELGRDNETLTTKSGRYALLGPTLLKRCHAACATVENERFAVSGLLKDYDSLPARAAAVLDVKVGHGARFLLARNVARGVPFYATVFTRDLALTRQLIDLAEDAARATVLARVVMKEPVDDWKGFFIFEKRPKPHPFAFVVEQLISDGKPR
jgi:transcriptional regulator with XRE-family HTH domain